MDIVAAGTRGVASYCLSDANDGLDAPRNKSFARIVFQGDEGSGELRVLTIMTRIIVRVEV